MVQKLKSADEIMLDLYKGMNVLAYGTSRDPILSGAPGQLVEMLERGGYINPQKRTPDFSDVFQQYYTKAPAGNLITGIESEKNTPVGKIAMPAPTDVTSLGYPLPVLVNLIESGYSLIKDYTRDPYVVQTPLEFTPNEMQALFGSKETKKTRKTRSDKGKSRKETHKMEGYLEALNSINQNQNTVIVNASANGATQQPWGYSRYKKNPLAT